MNNVSELIPKNVGVVVIGRNEGERLVNCINSLKHNLPQVIYVDSSSTDDSVYEAASMGAHVLELDMSRPFTAARARNAGFASLMKLYPNLELIQFVDGDCVVTVDWINLAVNFLQSHSEVAVVCGRRKELFPSKSIYNRLCDLEWATPIGQAKACGGDALMRVDVFQSVSGFRENLIAGEEPELCIRIRQAGYTIWRIDADMTLHDANIHHFSQWWKRTMRGGYAFAEGKSLHGSAPELHWVTESRRAWLWGGVIPLLIFVTLLFEPVLSMLMLLVYPLQLLRLTFKSKLPLELALKQAFFLIIGKFAEQIGQLKFILQRYRKKQGSLIEYK
jgi:GT2 family glycosyltransferase